MTSNTSTSPAPTEVNTKLESTVDYQSKELNFSKENESNVSKEDESNVSKEDESNVSREDELNVSREDESNVSKEDESNVSREDESNVNREDESNVAKEEERLVEYVNSDNQVVSLNANVQAGSPTQRKGDPLETKTPEVGQTAEANISSNRHQKGAPETVVPVVVNETTEEQMEEGENRSTSGESLDNGSPAPSTDDSLASLDTGEVLSDAISNTSSKTTTTTTNKPIIDFCREISEISLIGYPDEEVERQRLEALYSVIDFQEQTAKQRRFRFKHRSEELIARHQILSEKQLKNRNLKMDRKSVQNNPDNCKSDRHFNASYEMNHAFLQNDSHSETKNESRLSEYKTRNKTTLF